MKIKRFLSKIVLKYLQVLTKLYVKRNKIDIFGLTGSAGKTTLTLALYSILSKKYKTGMTYKHGHGLNSETGIPFALLGVNVDSYGIVSWVKYMLVFTFNFFFKKAPFEKYIVEMGVDKPGDMDFILSMTKADLGIFLSISKTHTANFEKEAEKRGVLPFELVYEEKAKLIKLLPSTGWAVINYDEPLILKLKTETKAKIITFGLKQGADVLGRILSNGEEGFVGEITYKNTAKKIKIDKFILGEKIFRTLLAAAAVGLVYEVGLDEIIKSLEELNLPAGRMSRIEGIKNTIIIDSSYNSSADALLEALCNLKLFKNRRKIAILGDMRELGKDSKTEHEKVAIEAIKIANEIITIGPDMKRFFMPKAKSYGFTNICNFDNTWEASEFILHEVIKGGEVILVKGSQNTLFLEIIVEGLMKDPSLKNKLLCRRGKFWDKRRRELKSKN